MSSLCLQWKHSEQFDYSVGHNMLDTQTSNTSAMSIERLGPWYAKQDHAV